MAIGNWNIPVYNAIRAYTAAEPVPFHMPGHKLGAGIPKEFLKEIEKLDLTEIPGTDNLHHPTGVIKEAQELAAEAFGAVRSFFLVNGSTVGLHTAIAALCRPGQRLIVGRDCHRAVINGMLIAGVNPFYILPDYSAEFAMNTGISASAVEKAMDDAPDAVGVLITRPNYFGVCSNVREIARMVHKRNKLLIVDEAHGAHLVFNSRLPESALEAGADICIQSAHKTLPAFTQGAYLHVGSERVDLQRVEYFLDIFQTTSPSYVIMTYLDIAREVMKRCGEKLLDSLLDHIEACSLEMAPEGIKLLDKAGVPGFEHDTTRVTVNTRKLGITGYDAEKLLREKHHIQVEMSDLSNIVCICTVADDSASIRHLFTGLSDLDKSHVRMDAAQLPVFTGLKLPSQAVVPSEILSAQPEKIPLADAPGRVSRELISPYPPGMALVCPGERFTHEMVKLLREIIRLGGSVHGIQEDETVTVVK